MTVLGEVDHDFTSGTAKRRVNGPIYLIIVSGSLPATDIALVAASGLLVRLAYPSGMESVDWQEYGLAILLAMFAAGTLFQWNGLYKLPGLSAGHLKLGTLAASWTIVVLALIVTGFFFKISSDFSRLWVGVWFAVTLAGMGAVRGTLWLPAPRSSAPPPP